jgi:hypothetical protein
MRIISFDVGIKNMAYCVLDVSGEHQSIVDWNVVNLMNKETEKKTCTILNKTKTKKITLPETVCGKPAFYEKGELCFCKKHAENSSFFIPKKECSPQSLNKKKIDELIQIGKLHFIPITDSDKRQDILDKVNHFFSDKTLIPIITKKEKAGELDLITIGRNLRTEMDKIDCFTAATHVIIENQISPIATRMKTIQGMLAQYFIMRMNDKIHVEFLSSSGKLKGFETKNSEENTEYKKHKKDAIFYCRQFLEKDEFKEWGHVLETRKKDDLADCFLQALFYLKNRKTKTYV